MGILDDAMADLVSDVVELFSSTPKTIKRTVETDDFATDTQSGTATVTYSIYTAPPEDVKLGEIDGKTVLVGYLKVLVPAKGLAIVPSAQTDVLTLGGVDHEIVKVSPIYTGDSVAAYYLFCKR